MKILLVIVNYNGRKLLEKHLPDVLKVNSSNLDIVISDNGSTDSSVEFIKNRYPFIKIVKNGRNIGFGRANNEAIKKYPNYDAYLLLNNDISPREGFLDELINVLETNDNVGCVGPKVLYSKNEKGKDIINSAGMVIDSHYLGYDRYEGVRDSSEYSIIEEVDGVTGATMLIPSKVWEEVGGFDERMFLYYEDVDLCLRIKDLGYKIFYCGKSVVSHDHMASSQDLGSFRRNLMSMCNRYVSIVKRKGFLIGLRETIWYIFNWFIWKIFYNNKFLFKEFLGKDNETK